MGSRRRASALVVGLVLWSGVGHAQAEATPEPVTVTKSTDNAQWPANFATAKQALQDGEWEKAGAALDELVKTAPSTEDARAARELASLARYWQKRDLAFVQRQSLGESSLSSKATGRRTTDEIVTLYGTSAIYGAGIGISMATILDGTSVAAFVIPAIIGAGAGLGGVAIADTFGRIRYGQAQAVASGALLGFGEAMLFDWWHFTNQREPGPSGPPGVAWDGKAYVGIGIATTTLGAVLGGVMGGVLPMTPGRASWVSSMGLWSGGVVACVTGAIAANTLKEDVVLSALVGYNGGILGGILTAGPVSPSISRVRLLDIGGLLGGLTSFGIYAAIATSASQTAGLDGNASLGITGLGIAAGLTTSWLLTMKMAPDRPADVDDKKSPTAVDVHPMLYPTQGGASAGLAGTF